MPPSGTGHSGVKATGQASSQNVCLWQIETENSYFDRPEGHVFVEKSPVFE